MFYPIVGGIAVGALLVQLYHAAWVAPDLTGDWEPRLPGEFSDVSKKERFSVEKMSDTEFRLIPPAPDKPILLRFTAGKGGKVFIDGAAGGTFSTTITQGCRTLKLGDLTLTHAGCPT